MKVSMRSFQAFYYETLWIWIWHLQEQWRVLKHGGIFVSLDTTHPPKNILSPFIQISYTQIIPFLGQILSGDRDAYVYLPTSTDHFLSAEELKIPTGRKWFSDSDFKRHMFGTVAIHWAEKKLKKNLPGLNAVVV